MRGEALVASNFEQCLQDFELGGVEGRAEGISIPEEVQSGEYAAPKAGESLKCPNVYWGIAYLSIRASNPSPF